MPPHPPAAAAPPTRSASARSTRRERATSSSPRRDNNRRDGRRPPRRLPIRPASARRSIAVPCRPLHLFRFFVDAAGRRDPERLHLAIEVAALDAEHLGGPRHVALLLGERAQDQVALELIARFVQRPPLARHFERRRTRQRGR